MRHTIIILLAFFSVKGFAQNLSAKSNELIVDFSDPRKDNSVSLSTINWITPVDTVTNIKEEVLPISAEVKSVYGLLSAKLRVKDIKNDKVVNEFKFTIDDNNKNYLHIDRTLTLPNGEMEIEILVENLEGFSVRASRVAIVNIEQVKKE